MIIVLKIDSVLYYSQRKPFLIIRGDLPLNCLICPFLNILTSTLVLQLLQHVSKLILTAEISINSNNHPHFVPNYLSSNVVFLRSKNFSTIISFSLELSPDSFIGHLRPSHDHRPFVKSHDLSVPACPTTSPKSVLPKHL